MSAPIGPGDIVECIMFGGFGFGPHVGMAPKLTVGSTYRVAEVYPGELFGDGQPGVSLVERPGVDPDGWAWVYDLRYFRPLGRGHFITTITLKTPAPERDFQDA